MEKKKYIEPIFNIIDILSSDVITTSLLEDEGEEPMPL